MKKLTTLLLVLSFIIFAPFGGLTLKAQTESGESVDEKPLLTIGCLSDLHNQQELISCAIDSIRVRGTVLNTMAKMKADEDLDIIIMGGDYTSDCTIDKAHWERIRELMRQATRGGFKDTRTLRPVLYATGNHDYEVANLNGLPKPYNSAEYYPVMEEDVYPLSDDDKFYETCDNGTLGKTSVLAAFHYVVDGFDFVVLNCGKYQWADAWDYQYSQESVNWAIMKLQEIYADNPDKTVFFLLHIPFGDSKGISAYSKGIECKDPRSTGWQLKQELAKHPNLIMLYGHDHHTDYAYSRYRTSQRITRYDNAGNIISTTDSTHVDGPLENLRSDSVARVTFKSMQSGKYLNYSTENNLSTQDAPTEVMISAASNNANAFILQFADKYLFCGSSATFSGGESAVPIYVYRYVRSTSTRVYGRRVQNFSDFVPGEKFIFVAQATKDNLYYALCSDGTGSGNSSRLNGVKVLSPITSPNVYFDLSPGETAVWELAADSGQIAGIVPITNGIVCLRNQEDGRYLSYDSRSTCMSDKPMLCELSMNGTVATVKLDGLPLGLGRSGSVTRVDGGTVKFFEVEDASADTITANLCSALKIGGKYIVVVNNSTNSYAMGNELVNKGTAYQMLRSVRITPEGDKLTMARNDKVIWNIEKAPEGEPSFISAFMGSMRYALNSIDTQVSTSNSRIVQALVIYVYKDRIVFQMKNYGESGTFSGINVTKNLASYTVYRNVVNSAVGIETPSVIKTSKSAGIYDLQGRRVMKPKRGLYIVDGKKTFVN